MNRRDTETAERKPIRVITTVCALCLCGSTVFAGRAESWPQLYNNGVNAYQSNDFTRAAAGFENATAAAERALQQRALYNLGNTDYRLGQSQPAQAQQLWQRALKHYESALALNPQDADAKFNQEFVKKKLEELKKLQQQNQKNQQDKKQEQNKDEQKDQEKKQDQQKQQNAKDQQSEQEKQQQSKEQQKQNQEQKDQEQQQKAQQEKSSPEEKPEEKRGAPENYDKMQATALLNDLRENERNWNFFPEVQMKDLKDSGEPAKDW